MKRHGSVSAISRLSRSIVAIAIVGAWAGVSAASAQGRGGGAWTTSSGDAQRTSSARTDPRISTESVAKSFTLLWKRTLDNPSKQPNAPTQPVLLPNIISYKGFKALAFVGGGADNVYAIDYDLSRLFWQRHLETAGPPSRPSDACPGLTTITRATPLAASSAAGGRGGRGQAPAAGGRGAAPPPSDPPMPGSGPGPNAVLGGVGGRGSNNNLYAISSDGKLHALNPQDGTDMVPPIPFLPPNARAAGSILIDTVLYAVTTGHCGGATNGVWAIDLANDANTVAKWETKDDLPGDGLAFGADGTIYVAASTELVSLAPKSLDVKSRSAAAAAFTSSPVVMHLRGHNVVVAGSKNGLVSIVDDGSVLKATSTPSTAAGDVTAVATADDGGTKWIFAAISGSPGRVAAFKVVDQDEGIALQPAWTSRDLTSPTTPAVINGVVFALSAGQGSQAAVLYALDASSGKELWNSGTSIVSAVRGVAPSGGDGQVYVVTPDGTLYAFGTPVER